MCGGGEGSEEQYVFNGRIWCAVKVTLRYRHACTVCGGNTWKVRKVILLELDGFVSSVVGRNGEVTVQD